MSGRFYKILNKNWTKIENLLQSKITAFNLKTTIDLMVIGVALLLWYIYCILFVVMVIVTMVIILMKTNVVAKVVVTMMTHCTVTFSVWII